MIKKILKKIFSNKNNSYQDMIIEMDSKIEAFIKASSEYTFKSKLELWTVVCCVRNIINQKIDGDIVETGVWKGGTLILVKKILEEYDSKKKIIGFDTFEEGFEKPKRGRRIVSESGKFLWILREQFVFEIHQRSRQPLRFPAS